MFIYSSSIICNGKILETAHTSVNNRIEKLIVYNLETYKKERVNETYKLKILGMFNKESK